MTIIFDGKKFAQKRETELRNKVLRLRNAGIIPKLAIILNEDDPASKIYVGLKIKTAARLGIETVLSSDPDDIQRFNNDRSIHGILVQLPITGDLKILDSIDLQKDVDGLRENSLYLPATVRAIVAILQKVQVNSDSSIAIIGVKGMVGKKLYKVLSIKYKGITGYDVGDSLEGLRNADVIICATGKAGLIKVNMVKNGVVLIDVGAPKPEINPSTSLRASFVTPVPGGVGPVTVVSLMENLVEAAEKLAK